MIALAGCAHRAEPAQVVPPQPPAMHVAVTGRMVVRHPYCGGAAPTPEMEEQAQRLQPVAGHVVVLRRGAQNSDTEPVATVTSDEDGGFRVELAPGTYCVLNGLRSTKPTAQQYADPTCMQQLHASCDWVWTVDDAPLAAGDLLVAGAQCFGPCYQGPYPP